MTDSTDELVRERRGPIVVLRLNRPAARNALTPGLLGGIGAAIIEAESDPEVRVAVITGTGEQAFCSGQDMRAFADGDKFAGPTDEVMAAYLRVTQGGARVPLIGAANGTAVGGGLELLLGCDVIVASSEAEFGLPEVKRGFFPAGSGTLIGTRVPLSIALEMTLTGDSIGAARAYELGLVNAVVSPSDVLPTALAFAGRIVENAPLGLAACKELVRLGASDPERAAQRLDHWRSVVFTSEDAKEGAMAFLEKRKPVWQGR